MDSSILCNNSWCKWSRDNEVRCDKYHKFFSIRCNRDELYKYNVLYLLEKDCDIAKELENEYNKKNN